MTEYVFVGVSKACDVSMQIHRIEAKPRRISELGIYS